jgi:hypothetical protein
MLKSAEVFIIGTEVGRISKKMPAKTKKTYTTLISSFAPFPKIIITRFFFLPPDSSYQNLINHKIS